MRTGDIHPTTAPVADKAEELENAPAVTAELVADRIEDVDEKLVAKVLRRPK
jgi:hypothetical protein